MLPQSAALMLWLPVIEFSATRLEFSFWIGQFRGAFVKLALKL